MDVILYFLWLGVKIVLWVLGFIALGWCEEKLLKALLRPVLALFGYEFASDARKRREEEKKKNWYY